MNAFKPGGHVVDARRRRNKANQAVLSGITGFHGDLARAHCPAIARTPLRLLRAVVRDVGIITGTGPIADARMPKSNLAKGTGRFIESKQGRIERVGFGIAILPNLVWIIPQGEISRHIEGCGRSGEQPKTR